MLDAALIPHLGQHPPSNADAADVLCRQTAAVCSEEGLQAHAAVGTGGPSVPVSSASKVLNAELESAAKPEL